MQIGRRIGRYLWDWKSGEPGRQKARLPAAIGLDSSDRGNTEGPPEAGESPELSSPPRYGDWGEEMEDERLQILRMVEEHKITAEEGARLLATLEKPSKPADLAASPRPRWLRIRATDMATGRAKVNVNIPVGVVLAAGGLAARFGLGKYAEKGGFNPEELMEALRAGAEGKLVDVIPEDGGDHVEIFVE